MLGQKGACRIYSVRGVDPLKKGIVWTVGDGRNLKIWSNPWLPREDTRKPVTPRRGCMLTDVDELTDLGTGWWDTDFGKGHLLGG
jgi:hypothetical protein